MGIHTLLQELLYPMPPEEAGRGVVREELGRTGPSMIARFGSTEIKAILYPKMPPPLRMALKKRVLGNMETLSGFFPPTVRMIGAFSELMYRDMGLLDVLGSWRIEEMFIKSHFRGARRVALRHLEPYLSDSPWTELLEGRKVLVIHPFAATIERQYHEKRARLFADPRVLPPFRSLETLRAVQSLGGLGGEFPDWFAALDAMKAAMDGKDYEVAILGCGAYGFPLAAHAKRQGRKAIHLGGATQLLFGIKGRRWEDHPVISRLFNEHWVRPAPEDVPASAARVENGCYW